jgi:hypothetical protein
MTHIPGAGRPTSLDELRRDRMHQVAGNASDRTKAARATFARARDFRRAAVGNLTEGLVLPAVSALHESARPAVTALAAVDGYRFSKREIEQYGELVDTILALAQKKLPTRRVPPPPN